MDKISLMQFENKIQVKPFFPNYKFKKSKYDYTDDELIDFKNVDFLRNESTCNKRVMTLDGQIYYCPGFVELNEPIMHISEYEEEEFNKRLYEFYLKPLHMCSCLDLEDIRRFCPVKNRCDKKMCHYLNRKITGENRFPFSNFCKIKESKYSIKMDLTTNSTLMIILNSLAKLNEAVLSLGTSDPNPVLKNRLNQIVNDVNKNISTVLERIEGEQNGPQETSR